MAGFSTPRESLWFSTLATSTSRPARNATFQAWGPDFEVVIAGASPSAVLADQVKSLDWRKRRAKRKGMISAAELAEVRAKIRTLIG
jgi:mRNA-degrading endonuclease toxin of MazEF toxin-antitoxin module